MIAAIVYAAKSSEDKHGSIATQIEDCRALAEREGWEVVGAYSDEAASAFTGNRGGGLARALEHAERERCALIVQHSDRLARGDARRAKHLVEYALWAIKADVRIRSVQDPQTFGDLLYAVVTGQRNHEDSSRKSAAVRDGLRRAAEAGQPTFGIVPDGYEYRYEHDALGRVAGRTMIKDPERRSLWELVWRLAVDGWTDRAIVLELDRQGWRTAPRKRTHRPRPFEANRVRLALANPAYAGMMVHRGEIIGAGAWEPYVSLEDFERVRAVRAERAHVARRDKGGRPPMGYLLAGALGRCACGARLDCVTSRAARKDGTRKRTYVCRTHRERPQDCSAKPIDAAAVDAAIVENLERLMGDVDDVRSRIAAGRLVDRTRLEQEVARAKAEADEADRRAARAKRMAMDAPDEKADAAMEIYADHRAEAKRARALLNASLDALDAPESEADEAAFYGRLHEELTGRIKGAGDDVRRVNAALADLFERFELRPTASGTLIRPVLSPDAAARILRDIDRWPHKVEMVVADGSRLEHGALLTPDDAEAIARTAGQDGLLAISGPEAFATETLRSPS